MMNTVPEIIDTLKRLKSEIEWDYSREYQIALDEAIAILSLVKVSKHE